MSKINYIFHLADIHIRNLKRHREYRLVFRELYDSIIKKDFEYEEAIIVIAGDIVHSKLDMSPELIQMVSEFLQSLSIYHHVLIIPGNHDLNLNNQHRVDALTPIIDVLKNKNITYLYDSQVWGDRNLTFHHISITEDYLVPERLVDTSDFNIALFHGPVHGSTTDIGFNIENDKITTNLFKKYDLTLLGDIHKRQFLDKKKTILYPGSLVQQNFGETPDKHGYALWDVEKRTCEFVDLHNDYGYYTLEVKDDKLIEQEITATNPKIRVKTENISPATLVKILPVIKQKYGVQDVRVISSRGRTNAEGVTESLVEGDVRDVEYQNELIVELLNGKYGEGKYPADIIRQLNRDTNSELPEKHIVRGIQWKPKLFEFSNMFSYGEDNAIDFEKMKGLYGLFAENAAGKSSILDALTYCCFDKCSKTNLAGKVVNSNKDYFNSKFVFELDGTDYTIERSGIKGKTGAVKVEVDFYYYEPDEDSKKVSLNGTERKDTNRIIRQYLGTYEEMVLTSLSLQRDNSGFIDMTQKERNELLSKFLDLSIFEDLQTIGKKNINESEVLLKDYKKNDESSNLVEYLDGVKSLTVEKESCELSLKPYKESLIQNTADLKVLMKEYRPVEGNLEFTAEEEYAVAISNWTDEIKTFKETRDAYEKLILKTEGDISEIIAANSDILNRAEDIKNSESERLNHQSRLDILEIEVKNKIDIVFSTEEHLDGYLKDKDSFDPNCKFCLAANQYKIDHIKTLKEKLVEQKGSTMESAGKRADCKTWLETNKSVEEEWLKLNELQGTLHNLEESVDRSRLTVIGSKIDIKEKDIEHLKVDLERFLRSKTNIQFNKEIDKQVAVGEELYKNNLSIVSDTEAEINMINSSIRIKLSRIDDIKQKIEKIEKLEKETEAYKYYLEAIKYTGVPLLLIDKALPSIQNEVNTILSEVVDFTLDFKSDGKNINSDITYGDLIKWPIEMTSGMERFISGLAIRQALTTVSTLPKPNFLAVDEGWGSLSAKNISNISPLLDILRLNYDFSIVISHIDSMKDMVDSFIDISKEEGFSNIHYV